MDKLKPRLKVHLKTRLTQDLVIKELNKSPEICQFTCKLCQKKYATKFSLQRHLDQFMSNNKQNDIQRKITALNRIEECSNLLRYLEDNRRQILIKVALNVHDIQK